MWCCCRGGAECLYSTWMPGATGSHLPSSIPCVWNHQAPSLLHVAPWLLCRRLRVVEEESARTNERLAKTHYNMAICLRCFHAWRYWLTEFVRRAKQVQVTPPTTLENAAAMPRVFHSSSALIDSNRVPLTADLRHCGGGAASEDAPSLLPVLGGRWATDRLPNVRAPPRHLCRTEICSPLLDTPHLKHSSTCRTRAILEPPHSRAPA